MTKQSIIDAAIILGSNALMIGLCALALLHKGASHVSMYAGH